HLLKRWGGGVPPPSGGHPETAPAAGAARADQIDERAENARARPRRHCNEAQVFHAVTAHDRNLLKLLPKIIGSLVRIRRCSCQIHHECSLQPSFLKNPSRFS